MCSLLGVLSLNTDAALYAECKRVLREGEVPSAPGMDDTDRRVLQLLVFDFEQTGVHLNQSVVRRSPSPCAPLLSSTACTCTCLHASCPPRAQRDEFVKCNTEIIRASARFQEGLLSARSVHEQKLPMRLRKW